jgi:hypothetical protein
MFQKKLGKGAIGSASRWLQVEQIHRGDAEIAEARRATQLPCCSLRDPCVLSRLRGEDSIAQRRGLVADIPSLLTRTTNCTPLGKEAPGNDFKCGTI